MPVFLYVCHELRCHNSSSNFQWNLRLIEHNEYYRVEAYWSRGHAGVRRRADGKHTWLAVHPNMALNIEIANYVAPRLVPFVLV